MTPPVVVGVDQSRRGTGIAVILPGGTTSTRRLTPAAGLKGHDLTAWVLDGITQSVTDHVFDPSGVLTVVEGLSFDSHDTGRQLAGLYHLITHTLWTLHVPYLAVPPATVKVYATDDGHADKTAVTGAARAQWPHLPIASSDEADALWLAAIGRRWLAAPIDDVPENHLRALAPKPHGKGTRRTTRSPLIGTALQHPTMRGHAA